MREIVAIALDTAIAEASLTPEEALKKLPKLRMRYAVSPGITVSGIVGHATEADFRHIVGTTLAEVRREIQQGQVNGDWQLVGWEGFEVKTERAATEPNPAAGVAYDRYASDQNPTKNLPITIVDPKLSIRLVFVDAVGAPWLDPWKARTGKEDGAMFHFSQTRKLEHAPAFLREEFKQGEALLIRFVEHRASAKLAVKTSSLHAPDGLTPEQLEAVRQMRQAGVDDTMIATGMGLTGRELIERAGEGRK
jgi:hypothetical protein